MSTHQPTTPIVQHYLQGVWCIQRRAEELGLSVPLLKGGVHAIQRRKELNSSLVSLETTTMQEGECKQSQEEALKCQTASTHSLVQNATTGNTGNESNENEDTYDAGNSKALMLELERRQTVVEQLQKQLTDANASLEEARSLRHSYNEISAEKCSLEHTVRHLKQQMQRERVAREGAQEQQKLGEQRCETLEKQQADYEAEYNRIIAERDRLRSERDWLQQQVNNVTQRCVLIILDFFMIH